MKEANSDQENIEKESSDKVTVEPNSLKDYSSFKEKIEKATKEKPKTSGLSVTSLVFAFLIPPIGLIMSMVARSKSKNEDRPTAVATTAIVVSTILFFGILGGGGFVIYRSYNKTKTAQQSYGNNSQSDNQSVDKTYSADEKKAIAQSEQFLNYIKSENYTDAFKMLSRELQKEYPNGEADFTKEVTTANLKLIDSWTVKNAETNGKEDRITVSGDAVFRGANPGGKFEFQFYKDTDGSIKMFLWQISPNT